MGSIVICPRGIHFVYHCILLYSVLSAREKMTLAHLSEDGTLQLGMAKIVDGRDVSHFQA